VDWEREPDPNGEVVDPAWLQRKPGLEDYFKKKDVRRTGDGRVKATRFVLSLLVAFLADEQDKSAPRKLLKTLGKINQLSAVRNSSFATHTFDGVTVERMAAAFSGCPNAPGDEEALDTIMSTVEEACELATGRPMAPVNPYDKLNDVVCRVLAV
jgi:hypothetical protein